MAIIDLEDKIVDIVNKKNKNEFIYEFIKVYDIPNSTITKLKNGTNNRSKHLGEVHLKNKLFFKETEGNVFDAFAHLEEEIIKISSIPRYLIATDYKTILAKDTKTGESLDISFEELPLHFDFFLAWNGIEKVAFEKENPLDIKAAERFARLFDVLNKEIDRDDEEERHALNLFLTRLLFCLFAEDTGIFEKGIFTNGIKKYTDENGLNMNQYLDGLFRVLDIPSRENVDTIYKNFPYVNGQLFTDVHKSLKFNYKSRKLMIECGELLEWSKINPDIFGSMIQAVATEDNRSHLGMHYTSVPNIMKVINPLFLDSLNLAFGDSYNNLDKLVALYDRIGKIKFFDPACGSGNFLIITYKRLRELEMQIFERINELNGDNMFYFPSVNLKQFFGIEIDDFAHEVAKLSLWIAEHQANMELKDKFGEVRPTLPLQAAGDVRCANALRVDWNEVCPHEKDDEIYLFGNPPYLGSKLQTKEHKADMANLFSDVENSKNLDYICGWFRLGAEYLRNTQAKLSFVSTNSVCQGEQVPLLWGKILETALIHFAYTSYKWVNNAKYNAGVTVIIIGLVDKNSQILEKRIYSEKGYKTVQNITPYLTGGEMIIVEKSTSSISKLPKIDFGSMPRDGGFLILEREEYDEVISEYPELSPVLRKYYGAQGYMNGEYRYCIWIPDETTYKKIQGNNFIHQRVEAVREFRSESKAPSTQKASEIPYAFVQKGTKVEADKIASEDSNTLVVPIHTSENRDYIPMGFVDNNSIVSNACMAIYNSPIYLLGILMSRMHMTWMRTFCGRIKTDYRYSAGLCYNTFPMPIISTRRRNEIESVVMDILDIREEEGRTLGELYNPKTIPNELLEAHKRLDNIVDRIYKKTEFVSDDDRLETLLVTYKEMVGH